MIEVRMKKSEEINKILGIKESFQLPDKLMEILKHKEQREKNFQMFENIFGVLSVDFFTDYFQESHSNRDKFMQDFTPIEVSKIINNQIVEPEYVADICAGIGGLSVPILEKYPNVKIYCEELSARVIPLLLFNLSYRNADAIVVHGDSLNREKEAIYKLSKTERYSDIEIIEDVPNIKADVVVMNPPYSLKHEWDYKNPDERFTAYSQPPKQYSDLGFVIHGLSKLKDTGKLWAILPHGVLFRANKEKNIRQEFTNNKILKTVVGLPSNIFLNTSIPVCLLELGKNSEKVLFIDAKDEYVKDKSINKLTEENIGKITSAIDLRTNIERFSNLVSLEEIEKNDFNLNIPRYVDTYVPEPLPSMKEIYDEYTKLDNEIKKTGKELRKMLETLVSNNEETEVELKYIQETFSLTLGGGDG